MVLVGSHLLAQPGTVTNVQKIFDGSGGYLQGQLPDVSFLGSSVCHLGDVNGDGNADFAAGAIGNWMAYGGVYVFFMNADGTVNSHTVIAPGQSGFNETYTYNPNFGFDVAGPGDIDGDGIPDMIVKQQYLCPNSNYGNCGQWVLFLNADGTVKSYTALADNTLPSNLDSLLFGYEIDGLGDIDSDGVPDLVVSADRDSEAGNHHGAVWVLRLNSDGSIKAQQKINEVQGGFTGVLPDTASFGRLVAGLGDVNGDGWNDAAVASYDGISMGSATNVVWILFLDSTGMVIGHNELSELAGDFSSDLSQVGPFWSSMVSIGDLDCNGVPDLAFGASYASATNMFEGGAFPLFLDSAGNNLRDTAITSVTTDFSPYTLQAHDEAGWGIGFIPNLGGEAMLLLGAHKDEDAPTKDRTGSVLLLTLEHSLTAQAGNDTMLCLGGSATFSAISAHGTPPYTYSWSPGATLNDSTLANSIATPAQTTTYVLLVTDSTGTQCSDSVTVTLTGLNGISGNAGTAVTICAGDSALLQASATCGTAPVVVSWTPTTGLSNAGVLNPMASPPSTTTYVLTLSDAALDTIVDSVTVVVPILTVNAGVDAVVCSGDSVQLGGNPTLADTTGVQLLWQGLPTGSDTTTSNPVVAPSTNTVYAVTALDSFGCSATDTVVVEIAAAPSASIAMASQVFCASDSAIAITTQPTGGTLSGIGITGNNFDPQQAGAGMHWLSYFVLDSAGCSDADSVEVVVQALPQLLVSGADSICAGDSASLAVNGASSYQWQPGGSLSDSLISNPVAAPAQTTTYSVVGTDTNGCSNTVQWMVQVLPLPVVGISGLDVQYCLSDTQIAIAATPPNGVLSGPGLQDSVWNPALAGTGLHTIQYEVADDFGCMNIDSAQVLVDDTLSGTVAALGDSILYVSWVSSTGSVQWYLGDSLLQNQTGDSLLPSATGFYWALLTSAEGCESATASYFFQTSGLERPVGASWIRVWPNPTTGVVTLQIQAPGNAPWQVQLMDAVGRVVEAAPTLSGRGYATKTLDCTGLPVGVYYLSLVAGSERSYVPLLLQ